MKIKVFMRQYLLLLFFIISFQIQAQITSGIYINEVMASNETSITDNVGAHSDWVELYNSTNSGVDLANYYMSDDASNLTKFRFTSVNGQVIIPANGYIIIWASGISTNGVKHTNFSLSASGEAIILVAPNGTTVIDGFSFSNQRTDVSYGRLPNGGIDFKYFSPASPSATNSSANAFNEILSPPIFSHKTGFFTSSFNLVLSHPDPNVTITYSTDASIPSVANYTPKTFNYKNSYIENPGQSDGYLMSKTYRSFPYNSSITIQDKSSSPNQTSSFSSTWHQYAGYIPSSPIKKGTVIRAYATKTGALPSETATNTYFFNQSGTKESSLPIISLTAQESHLFDYNTGIYTAGIHFDWWRAANPTIAANDYSPANYYNKGDEWEYPAHFDLIETNTNSYQANIGLRINGGTTRTYRTKSLRLYARTKYGTSTIDKKIFNDLPYTSFNSLLLHNGGQDAIYTLIKDASIHQSVAHLNFDTQAHRPSIVYLNGEYWGIHNIRQRYDKYYFSQKYGVNPENLDVITTIYPLPWNVDEGDAVDYNNLKDYISNNNLQNQGNYDYIKTQIDISNFIDYQISEIYFTNLDWPNNNIGLWRERVEYNPNAAIGRDGKWRWFLYDIDSGTNVFFVNNNSLYGATSTDVNPDATFFLRNLLLNNSFKIDFINRFADLLNTSFLPSRVSSIFNTNKGLIINEISAHSNRWDWPLNTNIWNNEITNSLNFIQQRPSYQRQHIRDKWGINGEYNLTVNVSNPNHGYVRVNTIDIIPSTPGVSENPYPWTGSYFNNIPIQIRPIAKSGYKFKHWIYNSTILTDSVQTITTSSARSYTAVFELYILSPNPIPTAINLETCGYNFTQWPSNSTSGTAPVSMKFVYMTDSDPNATSTIAGFTNGIYNFSSRTRINGLGDNGFSFINTSNTEGNIGYPGLKLGGAILALNTINRSNVSVSWVGRTIAANSRVYRIRLQYRVGDIQPFNDLLDSNGNVVEYTRGTSGSFTQIPEVNLPPETLNQPYIQILWRYYYTGVQNDLNSGTRDELGVDDIVVKSEKNLSGITNIGENLFEKATKIISVANVTPSSSINYQASQSITLLPGFKAEPNVVFSALIIGCQ